MLERSVFRLVLRTHLCDAGARKLFRHLSGPAMASSVAGLLLSYGRVAMPRLINEHDERSVLRPFVPNDLSQIAHVDHLAADWTLIEIVLFVGTVAPVTLTRNRRSKVG